MMEQRTLCGWVASAFLAMSAAACDGQTLGSRTGGLEEGTLPGGTPISVDIVTPTDGDVFSPGDLIAISGNAQVVPLEPEPDTALIIVLDVSGSTNSAAIPGCGGDQNGDGDADTVLDCEIAAALQLIDAADDAGTIGEIGIVVFASDAAIGDVGPAAGVQVLTAPDADANANGVRDLDEVLASAFSDVGGGPGGLSTFSAVSVGQFTSYGSGVEKAIEAAGHSTLPNTLVAFMSDGLNNRPPPVADVVGMDPPPMHTFAVGPAADCSDPNANGDLDEVAMLTGGSCTNVPNPEDLPGILPSVIAGELLDLLLTIDGGALPDPMALPVVVMPPLPGATAVTFTADTTALDPGLYEICATAIGQDVGAPLGITDCVQIRVNSPPVAVCAPREVSADERCQGFASIDDGSFDPDGDDFTCEQTPPGPYELGDTEATLVCTDSFGDTCDECTATVTVIDDTPAVVTIAADPHSLWPPNHRYHGFTLSDCGVEVVDNCGGILDIDEVGTITHITSDEVENGAGDGNTCDDAVITGDATANLRAERAGPGDGRVYRVHFTVADPAGNETAASCVVQVVHDQSPASDPAIDSGCAFCVGDGCAPACPASPPGC